MVTISNARTLQGENGPFVVLDLDGGPEVRISHNTVKPYLTACKATILLHNVARGGRKSHRQGATGKDQEISG